MTLKCVTLAIIAILWVVVQPSASAQWTTDTVLDEMDGTVTYLAMSEPVGSTTPRSSQYDETESVLAVACEPGGLGEYAFILFTKNVFKHYDTDDEWQATKASIKFDNEESMSVSLINVQEILLFAEKDGSAVIEKFIEASTVLLKINLPRHGVDYFRYPLDGAADAISSLPCTD